MGICGSKTEEDERSKRIDAEMRAAKRSDDKITKLLLLGAGESGKSTLFKQMKILYTEAAGFTKAEKSGFIAVVHNNILFNMQQLLRGCESVTPPDNAELAAQVLALDFKTTTIDASVGEMLKTIWTDPGVADSWLKRSSIQVQDALEYYMNAIDRISSDDYEPSTDDILRTRVRTSGIIEENFDINGTKVAMYDVGGQRSERRKWMHKFDDVSAIIYVAAISEYDQLVFEDNATNRQEESLQLFKKVFNLEYFTHLNFILFLNKEDLFREKLKIFPFRVAEGENQRNVDFQGPYWEEGADFEACVEAAEEYIKGLYQAINNRGTPLYTHFTTATDTKNMDRIMTAVKDIVLRKNLAQTGFYADMDAGV